MNYKKMILSEYAPYFLGEDGKLYTYVWKGSLKLTAYPLANIVDASAGLHNVVAIDSAGLAHYCVRATETVKGVSINDGEKVSGRYNAFAVLTKDGKIKVLREEVLTDIVNLQSPVKFVEIIASYNLIARGEDGSVWVFDWSPWFQGNKVLQEMAQLVPQKVKLPGTATKIASGNNGYNAALVNGEVYCWGYDCKYLGLPASIPLTAPAKPFPGQWKLIEAGDQSMHLVDLNDELWGVGENVQGEIGNGFRDQRVIDTNNRDGAWSVIVPKPLNVAKGRKFDRICKGNSFCFYTYARETSGQWSSWGARNKAGNLGNGLFVDSALAGQQANIADIPTLSRVTIATDGVYHDAAFFKDPAKYPPVEAAPIEPPIPPTPPKKLINQFTTAVGSFKPVQIKQYDDDTAEAVVMK